MKKLLFFLFVSCLFYSTEVNAQYYDYSHKIDIDASIQITNMNDIYNQVGLRYLGYGYYLCTAIKSSPTSGAWCSNSILNKAGTTYDTVEVNRYKFTEGGRRKEVYKYILLHRNQGFPYIKRYEAIEIIKENKELLELGLITQEKYDKELKSIQRHLEYL